MRFSVFGCLTGLVVALGAVASAEEVRLVSPDGLVDLSGELLNYDGSRYLVRTLVGELTIEAATVACEGAACPQIDARDANLRVKGSDTVGEELFPLLVEGYAQTIRAAVTDRVPVGADTTQFVLRDDRGRGDEILTVEVQAAGSSTGFAALIAEETDIAMSSRPVRSEEYRAIEAQGRGDLESLDQEYVVAVDSILIIVSPDNPVGDLTIEQASRLFSGGIRNWSELGGPDLPVNVYSRPEASGTRAVFEGQVLSRGVELSPEATIVSSNEELAELVKGDPAGIGYVGFASLRGAKPVGLTLACGIVTRANEFTAKTEEYPLERRLRFYVDNGRRDEHMQALLDFAISPEADGLIRQAGFIDLGVVADPEGLDMRALTEGALATNDVVAVQTLRDMLEEIEGASRLSTTFRFASGSSRLDNKAQRDIARMVEFLARPDNAGRDVLIIGFTDADGDFSANERLSQSRAAVVLDAIRAHPEAGRIAGLEMASMGFGELAPVGCNDDFRGRERNRRVEVWIR